MVNIPDKFGTNLPASYKNLVGVSASDFGGYDNMPQYLRDLLMSSQVAASDAAAGASSPASPSAAAQGAGGISSDAALGRMLYNQSLNPYYSSPIRGGRMFTSSFGGNGATDSDFALLARMQGLTPYERALIGTEGGRALDAGKALTQRLSSGITNPASAMGLGLMKTWGTSPAAAVTPAATTEEAKPATQAAASTGLASNPYVLNQTPEAMKYKDGSYGKGPVGSEKERRQKESDEIKRLIQQQEEGVAEQERRARDIENLNEHDYEERKKEDMGDMWPHYAQGGLVEMGEELRDKGRMGDSILAHISPDEARMLKMMGGAGTINPETGLPEYFKLKSLLKFVGPAVGIATGNPLLGALAGGVGGAVSGGGLEGALMGAAGGGMSGLTSPGLQMFGGKGFGDVLGMAKNFMGMGGDVISGGGGSETIGGDAGNDTLGVGDVQGPLTRDQYIKLLLNQKKEMSPLGKMAVGAGLGAATLGAFASRDQGKKNDKMLREQEAERQRKQDEENKSFRELIESQQPRNFTPAPADYYTYGNRPEHKYYSDYGPISLPTRQFAKGGHVEEVRSADQSADLAPDELKNYVNWYLSRLERGGWAGSKKDWLDNAKALKRLMADTGNSLGRGNWSEVGFGLDPSRAYLKDLTVGSPIDEDRLGKMPLSAMNYAQGGYVGEDGLGGGQDDTIPARLSNNEYVIPADVVAHLGDGTPKQGAKKLDKMIGNVRKHKAVKGHPPKSKPVKAYVGGLG